MTQPSSPILLVEDDPNDVLLIQRAFRKAGLSNEVKIISDGEEAIAYLHGKQLYLEEESETLPMLILLDLKLPRINGLEVLEWLRQQPKLKRLIVVVLTGSRENRDIIQAYDLGVNSYLVKPVSLSKLVEMIESVEQYWLNLNEKPLVVNGWNP